MVLFAKKLLARYSQDEVANRAAALSYYAIFSIGPLLFVLFGVLGEVASSASAKASLLKQISSSVGPGAAKLVGNLMASQGLHSKTGLAFWLGGIGLLLAAIGIFGQLQGSINAILHFKPGPAAGRKSLIRQRVVSLFLVITSAVLILTSVSLSAVLATTASGTWSRVADFVLSTIILALLIWLLLKTLPAVKITFKPLGLTSLIVAIFFSIAKLIIGAVIGHNSGISAFGAAGSVIVLLLWIFYSGQILYLGVAGLGVYLDEHPASCKPRYKAKGAVLKIETQAIQLPANLLEKASAKFSAGFRRGLRKNEQ